METNARNREFMRVIKAVEMAGDVEAGGKAEKARAP
jgi:hypothetical protein